MIVYCIGCSCGSARHWPNHPSTETRQLQWEKDMEKATRQMHRNIHQHEAGRILWIWYVFVSIWGVSDKKWRYILRDNLWSSECEVCNLSDEIHSPRLATQDVQIRYFKTAEDITTNELSVYSSTADPYAFTKLSPSELPIFLDIGANIGYHWLCFQLHFGEFHLTSFGKSRNKNLPNFRVSKTTD